MQSTKLGQVVNTVLSTAKAVTQLNCPLSIEMPQASDIPQMATSAAKTVLNTSLGVPKYVYDAVQFAGVSSALIAGNYYYDVGSTSGALQFAAESVSKTARTYADFKQSAKLQLGEVKGPTKIVEYITEEQRQIASDAIIAFFKQLRDGSVSLSQLYWDLDPIVRSLTDLGMSFVDITL